ncbi:type I-E CRISPR-associated protein Cse2/CasB [Streptomyces sp. KN37]|uniref:type I-E CRISPR-associated protein Cse2/CasB n=1 Tax=Streptomyces sp. KN37 TaxID=3090667 RepID=UPI002A747B37|nr:type I-E CRISPR-associated protein Cse2/CasB [Streptomyces sp. KN37]WPO76249.1 type I-E CRISPR-associated protein Cse2/CasB [Streptomyces sp. KN37]
MTALTTTATPVQRVSTLTGGLIIPLQRGYLSDESYAVAALARLRRGAGKDVSQMPDLWGLAETGPLHDRPAEGGRPLSEGQLIRAENAVHTALTLWALHQQSRGTAMHRPGSRTAPRALGAAVRQMMPPGEIAEPIRKRLVRAGTASGLTALSQRLRELILLLRGADIPLDYTLLAGQLYRWQEPTGREAVRQMWGRSYHSYQTPEHAGADTPAAADNTDTINDLTDKDAS